MLITKRICDFCKGPWSTAWVGESYVRYDPCQMKLQNDTDFKWRKIDICGRCRYEILKKVKEAEDANN